MSLTGLYVNHNANFTMQVPIKEDEMDQILDFVVSSYEHFQNMQNTKWFQTVKFQTC